MKYLLFLLLSITTFAAIPTVNGYRTPVNTQIEFPFWLGVSAPAGENVVVKALQDYNTLFVSAGTTNTKMFFVQKYTPILFYYNDCYAGRYTSNIPEPATLMFFLLALIGGRKRVTSL